MFIFDEKKTNCLPNGFLGGARCWFRRIVVTLMEKLFGKRLHWWDGYRWNMFFNNLTGSTLIYAQNSLLIWYEKMREFWKFESPYGIIMLGAHRCHPSSKKGPFAHIFALCILEGKHFDSLPDVTSYRSNTGMSIYMGTLCISDGFP